MKLNKQLFRFLAAGAIVIFTGQTALAAQDAFQTSAEVIGAIAIANTRGLNFGAFTPAGGGTVTIAADATGTRSAAGPTVSGGGNASASFDVTGDPSATFAITLPASTMIVDGGGLNNMPITFTDSGTAGAATLDGLGAATVYVGGTLTVAAAQASGTYTGNFNLTVEYN